MDHSDAPFDDGQSEVSREVFEIAAASSASMSASDSSSFGVSEEARYLVWLHNSTVVNGFMYATTAITVLSMVSLIITLAICIKLRHFMPLKCRQVKWLLVSHIGGLVMQGSNTATFFFVPTFYGQGYICNLISTTLPFIGFSFFIGGFIVRAYNKLFTLKKLQAPPISPVLMLLILVLPYIALGLISVLQPVFSTEYDETLVEFVCNPPSSHYIVDLLLSALVIIYYFAWIGLVYSLRKVRGIFNESREMSIACILTICLTALWLISLGMWMGILDGSANAYLLETISGNYSSSDSDSSSLSASSLYEEDSVLREELQDTLRVVYGTSMLLYSIANSGTVAITLLLAIIVPLRTYLVKDYHLISQVESFFVSTGNTTVTFKETLADERGRSLFRQYAQARFAIENVDFYELASRRKRTLIPEQREKTAKFLIDRFIQKGAKEEINIGERVRQNIVNSKQLSDENLFDDAIEEISNLIRKDLEKGFQGTKEWKELETTRHKQSEESKNVAGIL